MRPQSGPLLSAGIAAAVSAFVSARAQTSADGQAVIAAEVRERETGWEGDHMTGTWGGWRTRLVDRGIHVQAGYIGEVLANVAGGMRRGAAYEGLLELGLDLDTERLELWKGGTLHLSSLFPHGRPFSANYTGDILTASNIEAHESFRLYQFWYEQLFLDETVSIRFGQLTADDEFAYTEPGSYFLNSAFGWPAFVSANTVNTGPAFFVAAPGVRLRYAPNENFFVQAAVFDGDSFDSPDGDPRVNASGTRIHFSEDQGAFVIGEVGWRFNKPEDEGLEPSGTVAKGLPGEYKLGAWLHTGDFPSNFEDANGDPFIISGRGRREHSENFGLYAAAEQMLWRENAEQGLYAFARAGISPRDRSFFELAVDGGLTYQGLIPSRDADIFGIGAVYARVSRDIREAERLDARINGTAYSGFSDHESVFEVFYAIQLNKWWTIQPDFQWIFNPGATSDASDAVVVGVRTSIVF